MLKHHYLLILFSLIIFNNTSFAMFYGLVRLVQRPWLVTPTIQKRFLLNPLNLKHLDRAVAKEYKDFSPLHGVLPIETGLIRYVYQHGEKNKPVINLINHKKCGLFHLLEGQLRTTQLASNPGASLDGELIAKLLGNLHNKTFSDSNVRKSLITHWKTNHQQELGKEVEEGLVAKTLDIMHASYTASVISAALTRCVLLSYLYQKSHTKMPFLFYLDALQDHIPLLNKEYINKIYNVEKQNYTPDEICQNIENIMAVPEHQRAAMLAHNDEVIVCDYLLKQSLPPQVHMGIYSYNQAEEAVKDCVEAALREFCNIILAQPENNKFDCSLIPSHCRPHSNLIKFYNDYSAYSVVNTVQAGQEWFNLVSNISGIEYCEGNYEIEATQSNLLLVLNYLFGIHASNWKECAELLSSEKQTISCVESGENTVYVAVDKPGFYRQMFTIKVSKNYHVSAQVISTTHYRPVQNELVQSPQFSQFFELIKSSGQLTRYLSMGCLSKSFLKMFAML